MDDLKELRRKLDQRRGRSLTASEQLDNLERGLAEQWFPGKEMDFEGIQEIVHDPGDGSTKPNGYAMAGELRINPGDYVTVDLRRGGFKKIEKH